jgi:hypothetical protein
MNKQEMLKHRIRKYLQVKCIKSIADDYLPEDSDYFVHPALFISKLSILNEIDDCHIVEKNYDAILDKVNAYLA